MGSNGSDKKVYLELRKPKDASCPFSNAGIFARDFLEDYCIRHKHPVNAALHVVGVPAAFAGFYYLFTGKSKSKGGLLIFLGYLLQYLGHKAQGNEVGEVTLIKSIYRKATK